MNELIVGVVGIAVGWLYRGVYMYNRARRDYPFTFMEAARLIMRGGRA